MSRTKLIYLAQIIALTGLLAACAKKASDEIGFGDIKNSVYTNDYFGLNVTIPADWSVQDQTAQQHIISQGEKLVAGDDQNKKAALKASELRTVNLFMANKYPQGSPVANNPAIAALAEKVSGLPDIKRGKDYLSRVRQTMESSQMTVAFPKEIYTRQLGGIDFDVMDVQITSHGIMVNEKYYSTIMKDYALTFLIVFIGDKEDPFQQKTLDSVTFK